MASDDAHAMLIMVVDDDEVFRRQLTRALTQAGMTVLTAADADGAMSLCRSEVPEAAIVDLRMHGRSGLELVKELHASDPTMRILVLTGFGSIATAVDAIKLGAVNYLQKPATIDEILGALGASSPGAAEPDEPVDSVASLARAEWEHIQRVLSDTSGNISEAARRLGLHRRSLQRKLQKYPPRS
jgi:two-component system response regulator RegA